MTHTVQAPSKKILMVLIACVLAVSGIFFAVQTSSERPTSDKNIRGAVLALATEEKGSLDDDGDGLRNWEEELWTSDPTKKDSDGDGTDDGAEVREGRNPALAGPNDAIASMQARTTASSSLAENLTTTDVYAREVFARYLMYRKDNGAVTAENMDPLIKQLSNSSNLAPNAEKYLVTDLRLSAPETPLTVRSYGNALGEILTRHSPKGIESEYLIFGKAMQAGNQSELAKLDRIIEGYTNIINDYLKMEIPRSAALVHLNLINSVSASLNNVKGMRNIYTDPVQALVGITHFTASAEAVARSIVDLEAYFQARNVTFEQHEGAYALMNII